MKPGCCSCCFCCHRVYLQAIMSLFTLASVEWSSSWICMQLLTMWNIICCLLYGHLSDVVRLPLCTTRYTVTLVSLEVVYPCPQGIVANQMIVATMWRHVLGTSLFWCTVSVECCCVIGTQLMVWHSSSVIWLMNEVILHCAQLVLGWVTIFKQVYRFGM